MLFWYRVEVIMRLLYHARGGLSSGCTKNFHFIFGRKVLSVKDLWARPRPRKKISREKQKKVASLSDLTQTRARSSLVLTSFAAVLEYVPDREALYGGGGGIRTLVLIVPV